MKSQGGKANLQHVLWQAVKPASGRHHAQPTPPPHHAPHAPKTLALSLRSVVKVVYNGIDEFAESCTAFHENKRKRVPCKRPPSACSQTLHA